VGVAHGYDWKRDLYAYSTWFVDRTGPVPVMAPPAIYWWALTPLLVVLQSRRSATRSQLGIYTFKHSGTGPDSILLVFCFLEHPGCNSNQDYLSVARPAEAVQYTGDVGAQTGSKAANWEPIIRLCSGGLPDEGALSTLANSFHS
jgi:hypothetical protein